MASRRALDRQIDEAGPGDLRDGDTGEIGGGDDLAGDVTGLPPEPLGEGQRSVRLGVGAIRRPHDGIDALLAGDGRERRRQPLGQQGEEVGHGPTIVAWSTLIDADDPVPPSSGRPVRPVVPCPVIGHPSTLPLLPTSLVGSYAQPDWLIDRARLADRFPPRVRATELWRVAPEWLEEAQDDATVLAIVDQERAGLDIITDGEMRRESYSNRFATALDGVDIDNPGTALDRSGHPNPVPRVVGRSAANTRSRCATSSSCGRTRIAPVKVTVPGPFTMSQQAQNDFYASEAELALDYAAAVNEEIVDLFAAGADIVQIDEPYMQARPDKARSYGLDALARAIDGVVGTTAVHICFGYAAIIHDRPSGYSFLPELAAADVDQISIETAQSNLDTTVLESLPGKTIIVGVLDLGDTTVETPDVVADRIRRALAHVPADRVVVAPDCGMKYLPRDVAFGKMQAMVAGAALVRDELAAAS